MYLIALNISNIFQHIISRKAINGIFCPLFLLSFETQFVFYIYSTCQFALAAFRVPNGHSG